MSEENAPASDSSFGQRLGAFLGRLLRAFLRLVAILAIIALLGFVIFYLVPDLYQRYVQPYQTRIQDLEYIGTQQAQINQQLTRQLEELQLRVDTLEVRGDTFEQALDEARPTLEKALASQQARLAALESTQTTIGTALLKIQSDLAAIEQRSAYLASRLDQTGEDVTALNSRLQAEDAPIAVLYREVQILKAMELLTRSRLFLVENNLGLAEEDIRAARNLLASMQVPEYQQHALTEVLVRLDLALYNLPDSPVLAAEDLEVAWQLLKRGFPDLPPVPAGTVQSTTEGTATPDSTPQTTPTVTP
jgi:predicted RNase H-like nuclease (RuvC/YqgF family)